MKVTNDKNPAINSAAAKGVKSSNAKEALNAKQSKLDALTGEDVKVSLSDRAQDIVKAKGLAMNTPDVRPERVAELKARIKDGSYKVNADAVAERMMNDSLQELKF